LWFPHQHHKHNLVRNCFPPIHIQQTFLEFAGNVY
jgi:hypothetical protein